MWSVSSSPSADSEQRLRLRSIESWVSDVMGGIEWKTQEHTTLLESRTSKSWAKSKVQRGHSGASFLFMDSRASSLAGVKGRARSKKLNRIWRGTSSYTIAGNLYPAWTWGRSAWNRGDAPTRSYQIRAPSRGAPRWILVAKSGNLQPLRFFGTLPSQTKGSLSSARFVINLSLSEVPQAER